MVKPNGQEESAHLTAIAETLLDAIEPWYEGNRKGKGEVDSNVMCAGLYITDYLAGSFPLSTGVYKADTQVKGASGTKAKELLGDHGETRKFTREGGRTSRKTIVLAEQLANVINSSGAAAGVNALTPSERHAVAWILQEWFVNRVRDDYFGKQKISTEIDPSWSIRAVVANLIAAGRERGGNAAGAIVQHLVGAKLQIRFPDEKINIESYTTADQQTCRAGDYQIGHTAIHVTMSPSSQLFDGRCRDNIHHSFRPRVLVPADELGRAGVYALDADIANQVAIQSIEDFVGTNIEEVAGFRQDQVRAELRRLLELYNARIDQAESDHSLKVEIPENL
ncbi:DUF4928 family protein [Nocardia seriolae]|uniref:DUF4928 family protein n=1 Tax=Nocardia seriolae TaxID=37332 RepID=UPI0011931389|nr:DUF4928 family protein [Nocardia seriolae]GEM27782.1 hypothetical protein NS2_60210 [Nocardia seriolae NBRC 15557]